MADDSTPTPVQSITKKQLEDKEMAFSQNECEQFFRRLSRESLCTDWEKVATHCGLPSGEIEIIKHDYSKLEERSFQFLVNLRQKFPDLTIWSGKLCKALRQEGRNDLVARLEEFTSRGL
ncbi:uncharacterized protein LOC117300966 [Asterias rubens]|uniref:uncharacterized protein LOC117300966 n=1 Tax=Asterias rubens TaxID=7604 RepID=UPI001455592C|nr:uncharacterized protein LOC117300966 [Asterias rubens]